MNVVKNFFIYSFGSVLNKSLFAIVMFLAVRVLTPAEYGTYGLIMAFVNVFSIIIGLGLRQVFGIEYFHLDRLGKIKLANDIISIYLIFSVPIFSILFLNLPLLNKYIFFNSANNLMISVALINCFLLFFTDLLILTLMYTCKTIFLTKLQITSSLITLFLGIFFLYFLDLKILGILLAQSIGSFYLLLIGVIFYFKQNCHLFFDFQFSKNNFFYYIKYGSVFIPTMLFSWILSSGDRWVLGKYSTLSDVGIYSIADTIAQLYNIVVLYPLSATYVPALLKKFVDNPDKIFEIDRQNKKKMFLAMILAVVCIFIGYFLMSPILHSVLPVKYRESISYIWIILLGYVFLMGTYFSNIYIRFRKKVYFLAISLLIPSVINLILNIILIPYFNIYGCIIATLLSYIFYFILVLLYNNYLHSQKRNT